MAGANKRRAVKEQGGSGSSGEAQQTSTSHARSPSTAGGAVTGKSPPRYDGPKDATTATGPPETKFDVRNISEAIGMHGWALARGFQPPPSLPPRPTKLNSNGREVVVKLNTFSVLNFPQTKVYQYDVVVGKGDEKRPLIKKIWESKTMQKKYHGWLYDGNKLAWSSDNVPTMQETEVDLDAEQGRQPGKRPNKHKVWIKPTKVLSFTTLEHFMTSNGKVQIDEACLEAINFLDHLMREFPSQRYTAIKRSYFPDSNLAQGKTNLGSGVEAFKGVYSSMRIVHRPDPCKLSVNVDVANGTFWQPMKLMDSVVQTVKTRGITELQAIFTRSAGAKWDGSTLKRELKRYSRVRVVANHRGADPNNPEMWTIDKFIAQDVTQKKFEECTRDAVGNVTSRRWVTIQQYFEEKYNIRCAPNLPVIKMTKKDVYMPMDVLTIPKNQRYAFKLDDKQTSQMIKFAVTLPPVRWSAIDAGVKMLKWNEDPYLAKFKVKISDQPTKVKARVLQAPTVKFGKGQIAPNQAAQGRWRIDGTQFLKTNAQPLKSWGVCVVQGRGGADAASTDQFIKNMVRIYEGHGGKVDPAGRTPRIEPGNLSRAGEMITDIWNSTGNKFQMRPQILLFIVPDRNADVYHRIKKSCECRYGVVSQVMQASHVLKNQPQYISNVLMKINAKLGGATCQAVGSLPKIAPKTHGLATMCIGADVSHPAPGTLGGSFAALTMSLDLQCTRYAAQVNTNGHRVEMITTANFDKHLHDMFNWWVQNIGRGRVPQRVYYFRDGVSEGQYAHVLEQEVRDMKAVFKRVDPKSDIKVTVVVASKRHHVRFFPEGAGADRTGNPHPGTLVETGVTHPFEFDFYLNAHSAIKGTARPVHYHVLLNENEVGPDELQQFIFEHSFQYARSTTPVSIFPAVYYAHLASQRAKAHENKPQESGGKKENAQGKPQTGTTSTSDKAPTEIPPLIPINPSAGIQFGMWYI